MSRKVFLTRRTKNEGGIETVNIMFPVIGKDMLDPFNGLGR